MLGFLSVLYNPDDNAIKNIILAQELGLYPVVYLNKVDVLYLDRLKTLGIIVLGDNVNVGLGVAFNDAEEFFKKKAISYFIYFDQDTIVNRLAWKKILKTYEESFNDEDVGMLFYGKSKILNPNIVISSGSLFSVKIFSEIGNHDKTFFVEGVDYEMCLRLKINGYKIAFIENEGIDHVSLQDKDLKKIFGKNIYIRCYGMKRLKDFNLSHFKLLARSGHSRQFIMLLQFVKSLVVFNIKELFSRMVKVVF